ncbi:MAG TPA: M50 family metallopeptidase [Candidatus Rifleibacterium sp.]|mgnify:CR=1 FL=1|nr:M50 family metallopeptidase [Candidatus Rifleibacterium sp.]HPT45122.1 M50 family metallopeptidase [Candidatus Rifleibacterium sp.]
MNSDSLPNTLEKPAGNGRGMVLPLAAFLLAIYFWDSMLVLPIKYLTVFFHELSHGLAAVLTGGDIVKIEINANLGGVCWTSGGSRFIVTSAGYLGSLIWGCLILLGAVKTRFDQQITAALGVLLLGVTLIWVRNLEGIVICGLTGFGLLALAAYTSERVCDQFLKFLGLTSCLYVLIDIKEDLIDRSIRGSDAYKIAEMLYLPDWLVGLVWLVIAGFVTWQVLSYSIKEEH